MTKLGNSRPRENIGIQGQLTTRLRNLRLRNNDTQGRTMTKLGNSRPRENMALKANEQQN